MIDKNRIKQLAKKYNTTYDKVYKIVKAYLDKGIKWE
jgi:Mor family transcriptional regulator